MKKLSSILLAGILLLSGMNLSIATHFCDGAIAGTRISLSGRKATCGMRTDASNTPSSGTSLNRHCCDDHVAVYTVDKNYAPSIKPDIKISLNQLQQHFIPAISLFRNICLVSLDRKNINPPDHYAASAVHMAVICVFRI